MSVGAEQAIVRANRSEAGREVRLACRDRRHVGPTAGFAPGHVQGNLVVLRQDAAADFVRFCQRNPKPCPLIGVSDAGVAAIPELGEDLDIRTDLSGYRVWRRGRVEDEVVDVSDLWTDDLVAFVIGCSLSFEDALMTAGVPLRHIDTGANVPMYRTNVACARAGRFAGPMVVSMRPLTPANAIRAVQITSRFPAVHGAPIHVGLPDAIGISDLSKPDYGDAVAVMPDELPVFWACGVTPQAVIAAAELDFAITHAPGCMLVTDVLNHEFAIS
jgi:uncharacterized protein YcsI (UPF0317 family)